MMGSSLPDGPSHQFQNCIIESAPIDHFLLGSTLSVWLPWETDSETDICFPEACWGVWVGAAPVRECKMDYKRERFSCNRGSSDSMWRPGAKVTIQSCPKLRLKAESLHLHIDSHWNWIVSRKRHNIPWVSFLPLKEMPGERFSCKWSASNE